MAPAFKWAPHRGWGMADVDVFVAVVKANAWIRKAVYQELQEP